MDFSAETIACTCAHLADERKAEDITVLHVGPSAYFTEYFVIATGSNQRQLRAIAEEIRLRMKHRARPVSGTEGGAASGWVLIDLGEAVVHLFTPEARDLYDLELLWGDVPRLDWQTVEPIPDRTES